MRTFHKHWCKAFADVSVYKQLGLAQGGAVFDKLSTSTKICVNFNSLHLMPKKKNQKGYC